MIAELIKCSYEGLKGQVAYQPKMPRGGGAMRHEAQDGDPNDFSQTSSDGWIMTCLSCGNSGPKRDDCVEAIDDWHKHVENHG